MNEDIIAKATKATLWAEPLLPITVGQHETLTRAALESAADDLRAEGWDRFAEEAARLGWIPATEARPITTRNPYRSSVTG